jgi:DNA modification methylase
LGRAAGGETDTEKHWAIPLAEEWAMTTKVIQGHAVDVLNALPPESCHLVCTSPPYWNLRSYSTPPQIWPNPDGTPLCADGAHAWGETTRHARMTGVASQSEKQNSNKGAMQIERAGVTGALCSRCGCWRGELGQEPTVERYIANLVSVFDAVRRVLRRDGLCWVNLSGSFFNNPGGQNGTSGNVSARAIAANGQAGRQDRIGAAGKGHWLKPLDWVDTPGLFAHAMQRAGWYWRADICLVKVNPLPESVSGWKWERCRVKVAPNKTASRGASPTPKSAGYASHGDSIFDDGSGYGSMAAQWADCPGCSRCAPNDGLILRRGNGRPTRAWERFLVFAKAPGAYFDSEAVREPHQEASLRRYQTGFTRQKIEGEGQVFADAYISVYGNPAGRNLRDWQFWPTTGGVGGLQHFAAFPLGLPSLAIRAGTSERGVCGMCGAPWARIIERGHNPFPGSSHDHSRDLEQGGTQTHASGVPAGTIMAKRWYAKEPDRSLGWRQTCPCGHDAPVSPAVVLDPFVGAGTTLIAADRLGRSAIGIDVQPTYIDLAAGRAQRDAPLFADVEVERQAAAAEQVSKQRDLFSVLDELQEGVIDAAG